ncbi:hypothetical protein M5K25_001616 [Dendrobium thyrsiflorum]|uniref:Uncharacterized protein n=1 Tax=Dendrobium thyrsiflorum TaxID=117978 RepID=A0ABD0W2S9_DENTH
MTHLTLFVHPSKVSNIFSTVLTNRVQPSAFSVEDRHSRKNPPVVEASWLGKQKRPKPVIRPFETDT